MNNASSTLAEPKINDALLTENKRLIKAMMIKKPNVNDWQRISPIAILYFIAKFISGLFSNVIYIIPVVIIGYKEVLAQPYIWLPVALLLLGLVILGTVLSFYFFQYRLADDHIEIRSGVFTKKHINLPFSRIQNVKLEQPIYYRPFGYTCFQLDTAGSAKQEAKIIALKIDFAEQLKKEILACHIANNNTVENDSDSDKSSTTSKQTSSISSNEAILNRRSLSDLIIHGFTNNRIWIFIGVLAPFLDDIARYTVDFFNSFGIDIEQAFIIANKPWWQISIYALTLTLLILLPFTLFSIFGAIISFYNYTLSKIDDRYIRRSGLLTKHEVTMRLARLQMIIRQQDWLDVLLKRINLKMEQSNANLQNYQPSAQHNKIIVPSIKPDECKALIDDIYPENQMMDIPYQSISKHFLVRNIGYILLPLFSIISGFFILVEKPHALWVITPIFSLLTIMAFCRWLRWGFAEDENFIYIRKGMFGVDYYCFPRYKIQQTLFKQSWFLKRSQLANVRFILASGGQNIPFIAEEVAYQLLDDALFEVENSRKSWM
ncbi:MAG: PH domain-containing protein [Colwellia sp.]|nr:PH domain-containing protein [Colwellia sp.]